MNFPIYRKYTHNKTFFKIISYTEFEEINLIGSKKVTSKTIAKIFPEKQFILDVIEMRNGAWSESNKKEFEQYF